MRTGLLKQIQLLVSLSFCKYSVVCLYIHSLSNHKEQLQKSMNLIEPSPAQKTALFWLPQNWTKDHNIKPLKRKGIVPHHYMSVGANIVLIWLWISPERRITGRNLFSFPLHFSVVLWRLTSSPDKINYNLTSSLYNLIYNFKVLSPVSYKSMKGTIF